MMGVNTERVDSALIQSTNGFDKGFHPRRITVFAVSSVLELPVILPVHLQKGCRVVDSRWSEEEIYALIEKAIATPESSPEFEAVITELRSALKEYVRRMRAQVATQFFSDETDT
jgi:hypothetical protein